MMDHVRRRLKARELQAQPLGKRKRKLTLTYTSDDKPRASEQTQSPLFKLPLELRSMIYCKAVAEQRIHLLPAFWKKDYPTHNCCQESDGTLWKASCIHQHRDEEIQVTLSGLPLLQSCRRM